MQTSNGNWRRKKNARRKGVDIDENVGISAILWARIANLMNFDIQIL